MVGAPSRKGSPIARSSRRADDGLTLTDTYIAAAVRCAPPLNKPTIEERDACAPFLARELALLTEVRVVVALGAFGWDAALRAFAALGHRRRGRSRGSGTAPRRSSVRTCCSAPTTRVQQNTFTGRLTAPMFDAVIRRAIVVASG